ncbi:ABC transporter substrate-binding protein [Desulfosporosinus fructosivorans]|uniref:ABC transporter substrate-binding protein n=1 Tax=Desulfosporosinus fructosivorans TaxID=2018669 RepID=A0A4Z0R7J3_9FIRM|nr:ABC transporter substrate-binding protein [Desulfosporosinus fructosivorans]TGE38365.1 ABC transporter substrate-binding protein [Desulfosporosinus fructosivorans]
MKKRVATKSGVWFLALLMASTLLILGGCGTKSASESSGGISAEAQRADKRGYILIGIPSPSTGPLAGFGEASPWVENRALTEINKDGGILVKELNKKLPVKIKIVDTESNPTKAADVASKLVLDDKVDMLLVLHTPDTVNPVSAVAERYGIPTVSLDEPVDAWLAGGPYKWSYHAFWTVDDLSKQFMSIWGSASDQNKTVGYLFPNDSDGIVFEKIFSQKLPAEGYKIVDPGRFPNGTKDYSAIINQFKKENVQILTGVMIPPDFAAFLKQANQLGYSPKIVTVGKAYLFPTDVKAIGGTLAQGLTSEVWWSPYNSYKSSLTGESSKELCDAWTQAAGKQWTPVLGFNYAGMEIVADVLKRTASLDKEQIRQTIGQTDLNTMVGPIKYNEDHYSKTPLLGGQWTQGQGGSWNLEIINNTQHPDSPTTAKIIFPLP